MTSAVAFEDITERKRGESGSAKSDERQAFLLELSGCVAALSDPVAISGDRLPGSRPERTQPDRLDRKTRNHPVLV